MAFVEQVSKAQPAKRIGMNRFWAFHVLFAG